MASDGLHQSMHPTDIKRIYNCNIIAIRPGLVLKVSVRCECVDEVGVSRVAPDPDTANARGVASSQRHGTPVRPQQKACFDRHAHPPQCPHLVRYHGSFLSY